MWTSIVNSIRNEYNSIRIWPRPGPYPIDMNQAAAISDNSVYIDDRKNNPPSKGPSGLGVYRSNNLRISRRTCFNDCSAHLYGWPSRGGVIILEDATPPDFDFLELDHLDPPLRRDSDQSAEDEFCRKLLHLGANWWDSENRHRFVSGLENGQEEPIDAVHEDESLRPTSRERGWVRVAWPSEPAGALCVLACEKPIMGRTGKEHMRPRHYGIVSLARTMDERCTVLQRLGGTMYSSIEEYSGATFLKACEDSHTGEKGTLLREEFNDPQIYGGRPDDALNRFFVSGESV